MKYIGIIITVSLALIAGFIGYGRLQMKAEKTEQIVEKHDVKINEAENINIQQSVIMERNLRLIEKLEKKL